VDEKFDWKEIHGPHVTLQDVDLSEDLGYQGFCFSKLKIYISALLLESESGKTTDLGYQRRTQGVIQAYFSSI
jgi:hypothetical protein